MRKKAPFKVDHGDERTLVRQVTDGLRRAIVEGYYAPGDLLPSSYSLVDDLGVSRIVTRAALRQLAAEGLAVARPRVGTVVRDRGAKLWRGHVVFVYNSANIGYFQTAILETLRSRLNEEGYLFTQAATFFDTTSGKADFSSIDAALSRSVDLVMAMSSWRQFPGYLARTGVPYAYVAIGKSMTSGVGMTRFDRIRALREMAEACQANGIRKAVAMHCFHLSSDAERQFRAAGIETRRIVLGPVGSNGDHTVIERTGFEEFRRMISSGHIDHDTLYYFEDDYLARGALMAMAIAGLRAPEDIRVATLANAGFLPAYDRELTRIEIDPKAAGEAAANDALAFLKTGHYPEGNSVGYKFIRGATMA